MSLRKVGGIGGYHIPPGWEKASSGVYFHKKFGVVRRSSNRRGNVHRWLAEPLGCSPCPVAIINLRAAMLECELRVTERHRGPTQAVVPGLAPDAHADYG